MQIIIDIPDDTTKLIEECIKFDNMVDLDVYDIVLNAIKNGKPVPEHRGRLIDVDELRSNVIKHKYSNNFCDEHNIDWSINLGMLNILLADAPTIIAADKEAECK